MMLVVCRLSTSLLVLYSIVGSSIAFAAPVDVIDSGNISNPSTSAPGGENGAAGVAKKLGATAQPIPGTIGLGPGVALTATYIGEAAGNPLGGLKQGSAYAGQIFGGVDFDLARIAGIDGGSVHVAMVERHGDSDAARFIGSSTAVQEIYGRQKLRLTILTYAQTFADGQVALEVGRTAANAAFLTSPVYCFFQTNAVCGSPVFVFVDSNFTAFPASGWGGHAKLYLSETTFVHVGAYEANPQDLQPSDVGFDFFSRRATGVTIPFEIGYATDFAHDPLPRHYGIGGIYDASRLADPLLDAAGRPAALSGAPYRSDFGRSSAYARFDQMVWRPDPESPCGLTLFGVALADTSGRVKETASAELGLLQLGTFPGRDHDTFGFAISDQRFSRLFVDNILAAQASSHGPGSIPRDEIMLELNYGLQVTPAFRLTPNLQYVVNPEQASEPSSDRPVRNAFVIGAKLAIDLSILATRFESQ